MNNNMKAMTFREMLLDPNSAFRQQANAEWAEYVNSRSQKLNENKEDNDE